MARTKTNTQNSTKHAEQQDVTKMACIICMDLCINVTAGGTTGREAGASSHGGHANMPLHCSPLETNLQLFASTMP